MTQRTAASELERSALAALTAALESAGVLTTTGDGVADMVVRAPSGELVELKLKAASRVDPMQARRYLEETQGPGILLVVADELTREARRELRDGGGGFLDRRGHLYLRSDALHLDLDLDPDPRKSETSAVGDPIRGGAGITVASALLLHAGEAIGVRELARRTGLPVSTTSKALAPIRDAALIDGGQALIPDLFWALADVWHPERTPLAERPPTGAGVLSGTVAAADLGAPVAVVADAPPDLYVASETDLRALTRRHGTATGQSRNASAAVQPTRLVIETATGNVAHPLFVALDLAQDRARGREILDAWHPTEVPRVW